jgi:PHD/YefM family antitoxin component YafN of YafNO toxin-antitoxin module
MSTINSTEVQKSFGRIMDQAKGGEAVVVERYGTPRVVILDFERYRALIETERELLRSRLRAASAAVAARAAGIDDDTIDRAIDEARSEVQAAGGGR